jgi:alpha-glucuronidase
LPGQHFQIMYRLLSFTSFSFRQFQAAFVFCLVIIHSLSASIAARADDGYRLWLRYEPLPAEKVKAYRAQVTALVVPANSPTQVAIRQELMRASSGMLRQSPPAENSLKRDGALVVGTPKNSAIIANLKLDQQLRELGTEGFVIRSVKIGPRKATVIASQSEVGALYGTFHFLRLLQTLQPIDHLTISQKPSFKLRVLNHWDNLDGSTIERGYAGRSLWDWEALPKKVDPRLTDYARANASLGINGAVLNNVNASAQSLTHDYLVKTAAIADALRPHGVRVYLSARFSAPIEIGKLKTADPLNPGVVAWWKAKADEIYRLIPDFGGFLVKANSEGQPGPLTYKGPGTPQGRRHVARFRVRREA